MAGLLRDALLRLAHRAGLQLADDLLGDLLGPGELHRKACLLALEGASGGRDAYVFQPLHDGTRNRGDLLDVFDLAVQHGALPVIGFFDGQNVEFLSLHAAQYADDAAGTDIQGENIAVLLFSDRFHRTAFLRHSM